MLENANDLLYTKEHEWIKVEGGVATIGITDYAQSSLTDIVFVELPEKGKQVEQSKSFAVVESVKSVSEVYAPASGEIVEVNATLGSTPEKINKDPYGEGWIAKIKIKDKKELDSLMKTEQYEEYLKTVEKH